LSREDKKKWWTIFCITNFQKESTNNLKEGLSLSHALTPFSWIALTIKEKMGFCDGLYKRWMFQQFFLNSTKAFVEVILLKRLPQTFCKVGIID
jgi:hypothetical protein